MAWLGTASPGTAQHTALLGTAHCSTAQQAAAQPSTQQAGAQHSPAGATYHDIVPLHLRLLLRQLLTLQFEPEIEGN